MHLSHDIVSIQDRQLVTFGRFPRMLRLRAEGWEFIESPDEFVSDVRAGKKRLKADVFTFLQKLTDASPPYAFYWESHPVAALPVSTYQNWWSKQINNKTRNMIRKAEKQGVVVRVVEFDDALVRAIKVLHDEAPVRQGKRFRHYGKELDVVRREHETFRERSDFIGAFWHGNMIGYAKLVNNGESAGIMQIVAMVSHRDKAPTNALISKAVELCSNRSLRYLTYGSWSGRSMGQFKMHHGFQRLDMRRYFVPLTVRGQCALALQLHRKVVNRLPSGVVDVMADVRAKWYAFRRPTP